MYDAKNAGMGGAGVAHLDTPVAVFHNPANLAGSKETQLQGNLTALIVQLGGSFSGPDQFQETDWLAVPLPFFGLSYPVNESLTVGSAFYFALGFGGGYDDVKRFGTGAPCTSELDDVLVVDGDLWLVDPSAQDNDFCLDSGREEYVGLAIFEASFPFAYQVNRKLKVGAALRFPFGMFEQKTTQDIWGAFINNQKPIGGYGLGYTQVKSKMYGYGKPGFLLGVSYQVWPFLTLAATYRSEVSVTMEGDTDLLLGTNVMLEPLIDNFGHLPIGSFQSLIEDLPGFGDLLDVKSDDSLSRFANRLATNINSEIEWSIPRAIELGLAINLTPDWLLAIDWRHQYHSESNKEFLVMLKEPIFEKTGLDALGQTLAWKDVYVWSFGLEYDYSDAVKFRVGYSVGNSATPETYTNPFTPPPADKQDAYYWGVGWLDGRWQTDFALSYARVENWIEEGKYSTCQPGQLVKSGCPGAQSVTSIFVSLSLNYIY
ncbi:MAG: outer membrane protein transport protein [Pseudomonadales bacterium]|nr:outer membrane protein transport protein [Pseudomonadales bacterium]